MTAITLNDFSEICRGCLSKTGEMRPIFGSSLDDMIRNVTDIDVKCDDGLPEIMCVSCILQVSRAYTFRKKCRNSHEILQSLLTNSKVVDVIANENDPSICQIEYSHSELNSNVVLASNLLPVPAMDQEANLSVDPPIESQQITSEHENNELITLQEIAIQEESIEHTFNDLQIQDINLNESKQQEEQALLATLSTEVETLELNISFECELCSISFKTNNELQTHIQLVHKTSTVSSNENDICALQPISDINKNAKLNKFECPECHKCFAENKILKRHLKIHSSIKPHICSVCTMSFAESSNLTKHMKRHTGELRNVVGKPNLCSVCGKGFKWASSLSKHMKHHTRRKILTCPYCPKYYVEARSLNIHMRTHTGEKPFVCPTCNKGFTQMGNLEKHLRVHTGERPFSCPVCNKGFSQSGYVAIHLRTHTGEKPYICEDCGKAFAGSNTLAIHKRTHTGERPYPCGVCDKTFARQETAIIHQRTHTGERPFTCNLCSRGFTSSGHLTGHMRSHNGIKTHECKVCQKRFAGSSSLKVHMKTHVDKNAQTQQEQLLNEPDQQPTQLIFDDKNAIFQCNMCKMNIPSTILTSSIDLQAYNHEFIDDVLICSNITTIIEDEKIIDHIETDDGSSIVLTSTNDSDDNQQLLINLSDLEYEKNT